MAETKYIPTIERGELGQIFQKSLEQDSTMSVVAMENHDGTYGLAIRQEQDPMKNLELRGISNNPKGVSTLVDCLNRGNDSKEIRVDFHPVRQVYHIYTDNGED